MSELSPGSKATTSLFMVLGVVALLALAFSVGNREEKAAAGCAERLQKMGQVVWDPQGPIPHPGDEHTVTLSYLLAPDGTLQDVSVTGTASEYDDLARDALRRAQHIPDVTSSEPIRCSYTFLLKPE
jgi:hypothetical protein